MTDEELFDRMPLLRFGNWYLFRPVVTHVMKRTAE